MKQFRRRMLLIGFAVTVVLGTTAPTVKVFANQQTISNTSVTDVNDNHWAQKQIDAFIKEGIIQGYPDKTFKPSNKITRAEFVRIVNRAFGFNDKGTQSFKDVKSDAWYTDDIKIAVKKGYINGFEDNTFRPNEEITREQMAKILGMVLNVSGDGKTNFLDDAKISSWAKKYVDGLEEKGIIKGYEDKTFKPKENATRAESIILISDGRNSNSNNGGYYPVYPDTSNPGTGGNPDTSNPSTGGNPDTSNPGTGGNPDTSNPDISNPGTGGNPDISNPGTGGNPDISNEITLGGGATTKEVEDAFNSYEVVKVKDAKLDSGVNVPEGKTLVLLGDSSIDGETKLEGTLQVAKDSKVTLEQNSITYVYNNATVDLSQGIMKLDGTLSLEEGGTLDTQSSSGSSQFTKDIKSDEAKITGTGVIKVGDGTIQVGYLGEVEAKVDNVTPNSKLSIGKKGNWILNKELGEKSTLTLNSGTLSFEFSKSTRVGNTHYMIVNGDLTFNNAYRFVVVKSGNKDAKLNLNNVNTDIKEVAYLYDHKDVYVEGLDKSSYTGNEDGTWKEVIKEQIVNINYNVTTDSTVTTDGTIKLDVTTSGTTTGDTTKVLIDGNDANGQSFDLKNTDGINLRIETATDKKVNKIVINGKEVELPETLDNGAIITLTLTKEDLEALVGENGTEFNITVVTN